MTSRFRFHRAGVLNVWQYDDQVFDFADGRLLLRGANGAGKSKTMEMLLPFVLDGDQTRLTASGRHHTSLVWLLLDGYRGSARTGYLWVEFVRDTPDGPESLTCGVGLRATASARAATSWFFTTTRRVGIDLDLEAETGPLSHAALTALLAQDEGRSHVFDSGRRYREHVGQHLFGLPLDHYESLLRLIYWLRRPQVGEDIDPKRLAAQLVNALPFVDPDTLAAAGTTFDDLQAHGEEIERAALSASAVAGFVQTYAAYARSVVTTRGEAAQAAAKEVRDARRSLRQAEGELTSASADLAATDAAKAQAGARAAEAQARIAALEASPEAKSRASLAELRGRVATLADVERDARRDLAAAQARAEASVRATADATRRLDAAIGELRSATAHVHTELLEVGAAPDPVPAALALLVLADWASGLDLAAHAQEIEMVAAGHTDWTASARTRLGERQAAVTLVAEALTESDTARRAADAAQRDVDRQEQQTEKAIAAAALAADRSREAESLFADAFGRWREEAPARDLDLPGPTELTAPALDLLPGLVERAIAPERHTRAGAVVAARIRRDDAATAIAALRARRAEIEAQVDPIPEPPPWLRDPRDGLRGAPLWRVVDFRPDLGEGERAGLEAALGAAGVLDAWITPRGLVLDDGRRDLGLAGAGDGDPDATERASLHDWLIPAPAADAEVPTSRIAAILAAIGALGASGAGEDQAGVAVGTDGRWVAGPAHGRTTKDSAQFIGASARERERRRRLAQLDAEIGHHQAAQAAAESDLADASAAAEQLDAWVARRPGHADLLGAWAREAALAEAAASAETELTKALAAARTAREQASTRHTDLVRLGELHDLPITADGLRARRERLVSAQQQLTETDRTARGLTHLVREWQGHAGRARGDRDEVADRERRLAEAGSQARTEQARHDELAASAGADIAELERRLTEQRSTFAEATEQEKAESVRRDRLLGSVASLTTTVQTREQVLAASEPRLEHAYDAFSALYAVAGLIEAAQVSPDPDLPPSDPAQVRRMTTLAASGTHASSNDLLQALAVVQSGPASVVEPRLVDVGGAMAAIGRGDTGDLALPLLADRLAAKVEADRLLLTERERELFETHVLGQLGDALRAVRRQADELVEAMNAQLQVVTTSQGIRVRLRWRLRDDIPADARRAVKLLGQPSGALLAEERSELRDALHRLIDISRTEAPEDSYTEHLARALDYREWFSFTVQYHRPEAGEWRDLQSRSALSQGEQKVLCYLPLFAAAAAHFTSLAGAAPHAPRFVLLDDAFPKIDARTHPLLFGLLVDLDLDFVVTSERLWGTHATVPSLAIYEALRNPAQRGIAQFEHRWDGHQLTAVGADG